MNTFQDLSQFSVKTKIISFIHDYFRVFDAEDKLIGFAQKKGFKLKEDMRVFSDESKSEELIRISTDQIIDIAASYKVYDSKTNAPLGIIKRSGFKSIARDHWVIMDAAGEVIYELQEDSLFLSLVRRVLTSLVPAKYILLSKGQPVGASFAQNFNPFLLHFRADLSGWDDAVDKRLALAMVILLLSIEGKQGS